MKRNETTRPLNLEGILKSLRYNIRDWILCIHIFKLEVRCVGGTV